MEKECYGGPAFLRFSFLFCVDGDEMFLILLSLGSVLLLFLVMENDCDRCKFFFVFFFCC